MHYWDSSALVKLYSPESDSGYFEDILLGSVPIASSSIVLAEMVCALTRKSLRTPAYGTFLRDCQSGKILLVTFDDTVAVTVRGVVVQAYSQQPPIMIRALDAIHVASAIQCGATVLGATDTRLRQAASRMGLPVLP